MADLHSLFANNFSFNKLALNVTDSVKSCVLTFTGIFTLFVLFVEIVKHRAWHLKRGHGWVD